MSYSSAVEWVMAIAPAFTDAAVRGALIFAVALALTYLLRRRSAATRHLIWVGAVLVQLALPLFSLWGPTWNVAVPSVVAALSPVRIPTAPVSDVLPGAPPSSASSGELPLMRGRDATTPTSPNALEQVGGGDGRNGRSVEPSTGAVADPRIDGTPAIRVDGVRLLVVIWALGAIAILVRLAMGTAVVATLARQGARVDDGAWLSLAQRTSAALKIARPLTLLRGTRLGVPVTWGVVYPVVLLPDDADEWPEERRRFVLVHEMAHVKRLDALTQLAGQLALALFWFNPLVWIANRRMQLEREHACDDYVIRHGTVPSTYAAELLAMVRSLGARDERVAQPAFAALAMARRSEFEGRMLSILDPRLDRHPLDRRRTTLSALAALVLVVPLAALRPYQRVLGASSRADANVSSLTNSAGGSKGAADSRVDSTGDGRGVARIAPGETTFVMRPNEITAPLSSEKAAPTASGALPASTVASGIARAGQSSAAKAPTCDSLDVGGSPDHSSTHILNENEADGSAIVRYASSRGGHCESATMIGQVTYTENETGIADISPGARVTFRERTAVIDRELTIKRQPDGAARVVVDGVSATSRDGLVYDYRHNGAPSQFGADGERWLAAFLPRVLVATGVNVAPRVARWRKRDGVGGALTQIAAITSSSARRAHYVALLSDDSLTSDDVERIVQGATQTLRNSSDLRAVLTRALPRRRPGVQSVASLERAVATMSSSSDKAAVIRALGQTSDREMLLAVMRVTQTIASSGEQARLLHTLAPRYLGHDDKGLATAYFAVVRQVPSSGDRRGVLMNAIPFTGNVPSLTHHIIEVGRTVPSSGDRAALLLALVNSGSVRTRELRDAFYDAAAEIPSDGDRSRVLMAAARAFK